MDGKWMVNGQQVYSNNKVWWNFGRNAEKSVTPVDLWMNLDDKCWKWWSPLDGLDGLDGWRFDEKWMELHGGFKGFRWWETHRNDGVVSVQFLVNLRARTWIHHDLMWFDLFEIEQNYVNKTPNHHVKMLMMFDAENT